MWTVSKLLTIFLSCFMKWFMIYWLLLRKKSVKIIVEKSVITERKNINDRQTNEKMTSWKIRNWLWKKRRYNVKNHVNEKEMDASGRKEGE